VDGHKYLDFFNKVCGKTCVLFGAGPAGYEFLKKMSIPIAYVVDNDSSKWNETFQQIPVRNPEVLLNEDKKSTVVIISIKEVREITEQLNALGFRKNESILISPFIMDEDEIDHFRQPKLLVSCIGYNGGVFIVDPKTRSTTKLCEGDCRGIIRHDNSYIIVLEKKGFIRLDKELSIVQEVILEENLNLHGLALGDGDVLYVNECGHDAIGIYDACSFEKKDEIVIKKEQTEIKDAYHLNDVAYKNNQLYVSMFSINGVWRNEIWNDGAIAIVDTKKKKIRSVVLHGLKQPHSIHLVNDNIALCNSMECEVREGDNILCQIPGYSRGLTSLGPYYFIGQSQMRRLSRFKERFTNLSMDCGIHIWHRPSKTSRFLTIPAQGIFDILIIE